MCLHPNYGSVEFMFQPLIRTRGKFTATNMRGADYAGDTRKDGGATFSSPSVDQEGFCYQAAKIASSKWRCRSYWTIESRIIGHGEAVAQSWLRARGSDQPQLAKKLRDLGPFELVLDCGKGGRSSLCSCPTAPRHSYASVQKKARRRVTDSGFDHNQSRVVTSDFV
ncbi:hypothetical protein NC652_009463 [Populus alba x Populus x berolinensis]|nr:hypothetical protein NC652_009463 [Populus alba x Populus x berolinensis]